MKLSKEGIVFPFVLVRAGRFTGLTASSTPEKDLNVVVDLVPETPKMFVSLSSTCANAL